MNIEEKIREVEQKLNDIEYKLNVLSKIKESELPYLCDKCNQLFKSLDNLEKHVCGIKDEDVEILEVDILQAIELLKKDKNFNSIIEYKDYKIVIQKLR